MAVNVLKRTTLLRPVAIQPCQSRTFFSLPSDASSPGVLTKKGSLNIYKERKVLPYTQEQLYKIIADIDLYSSFIPYLSQSKVLTPSPSSNGQKEWLEGGSKGDLHELQAKLTIGFSAFEQSYVSDVRCRKWDLVTATSQAPDLFKVLSTTWKLLPQSERSTEVSMDLTYQFASPLYAAAAGSVFQEVSKKVMKGFEKRCKSLYG